MCMFIGDWTNPDHNKDRRDRILVGFTTTCAISSYHH